MAVGKNKQQVNSRGIKNLIPCCRGTWLFSLITDHLKVERKENRMPPLQNADKEKSCSAADGMLNSNCQF